VSFTQTIREAWANSKLQRFVVPRATCLNVISYQFTAISHLDILFITGYNTFAHEMFVSNSNIFSL
jgi:hypothetical protein